MFPFPPPAVPRTVPHRTLHNVPHISLPRGLLWKRSVFLTWYALPLLGISSSMRSILRRRPRPGSVQILQLVPVALDVVDCVGHHSGHTSLASLVPHFEYVFHHVLLVRDSIVHHAVVLICSFAFLSFLLHEYHSKSRLDFYPFDDIAVMPI